MTDTPKSGTHGRYVKPEGARDFGKLKLVRDTVSGVLYVSWYEKDSRQTRRASLDTVFIDVASEKIQKIIESKLEDSPKDSLHRAPLFTTVREVLEWHRAYVETTSSGGTENAIIDEFLAGPLADRRIGSLEDEDFEALRDAGIARGHAISTVSRRLSTLRSAFSRAQLKNRLKPGVRVPYIEEFRTLDDIDAAEPKGRACTTAEIARLYDAAQEPHFKLVLVFLMATAARVGAIRELTGEQIDLDHNLIFLNKKGRVQTNKRRPILPIIPSFRPWLIGLPKGHLITWRGRPVDNLKKAFQGAVKRADLPSDVNSYSFRHSIGQFFSEHALDQKEISLWLGHLRPGRAHENRITSKYAPFHPSYLAAPKTLVEDYFREISGHTKAGLFEPPDDVTHYLARLRHDEPE